MKRTLLIGLFLGLSIFSMLATSPKYEMRAVWICTNWALDWPSQPVKRASDQAKQQAELIAILDELQAMGINTVFFQARTRGEVFYASQYEPWATVLSGKSGPGYDPLEFMVEECHRRAMECHAWMITFPAGSSRQVKRQGSESLVSRHKSWCKRVADEWYLDPGNPAVEKYLTQLVGELVAKYDIDGVHLDYVRYPDDAERFPDTDSFHKWGRGYSSLMVWREANITRVVSAIYDTVKGAKPWVQVSSAPLGRYASLPGFEALWSCMEAVSQNPKAWLASGKHDFIVPMLYYQDPNYTPFLRDWATDCPQGSVASGLGAYRLDKQSGNWEVSVLQQQIEYARQVGVGQAYFRYNHLHRHTLLRQWLSAWFYRYPALTPRRDTALSPTPESPRELQAIEEGEGIALSWEASPDAFTYVVYATNDTLDPTQGEQIVMVLPREVQSYRLSGDYKHIAVTARNRYGQESHPAVWHSPCQEMEREIYKIEYYITKHKK